ncbi:hypothetical protein [Aureimonas phyllosphaerae]|uniref:Uncharacterized membrane protein YuzA (DUF378 family) n=1 Tax=Aureimonas phyllosphaerae TaxID=1166078 RepID=A0A7W6FXL2_9HYPH|nr:hypothetical protein [Aureimonas phyllosphaerae]MBB3938237.1 uncharacterized membrane protein YuzA (DUF378 family) [Aureimonas phyllosphaerae]MBB3962244.1 uncharacterized membrane protein YuzA (DUF378 family) [Aureimonas phyllosphaerae]
MIWLQWIFRGLNVAVFLVLIALVGMHGAATIEPGAWEYKDLVAVLLSVVSIIVTFIGIIVAIAAIWGYQTIRSLAEEKAIEASQLGSAQYLASSEFKADLKAQIEDAIRTAAREAVQDELTTSVLRSDVAPEHQAREEEWRD